jgi:AcrR family transcriptional regulator
MGEQRDAERTRAKIMTAARDEFAAHGLAGARIDAIAKRAGIAKQLIYHYFSGKEALFEAVLASKYSQHKAGAPGEGPGALFRNRFEAAARDPVWMRFLTWEAAEHPETGRIVAEEVRRAAIAKQAERIAERQASGELPADLDPAMLQLAIYALAIYPLAFGQVTRMIDGRSPEDPGFQADWKAFLTELATRLAKP